MDHVSGVRFDVGARAALLPLIATAGMLGAWRVTEHLRHPDQQASFGALLTAGAAWLLVACAAWAVAVATAVALEVVSSGRVRLSSATGVPRSWRLGLLLVCGVAAMGTPAYAAGGGEAGLNGLPLPDRPTHGLTTTPLASAAPASSSATTADPDSRQRVVVRSGDSLWRIAADLTHAPEARLPHLVAELHHANAAVIGSDPDLVRPGQRLVVPAGWALPGATLDEGAAR